MKALLLNLQNRPIQQRENRHRPVTPEQVAEYTNIPLATIYQKLANREIPGSKPGKRWVIYLDEIDKWLEANRKNPIPLTDEEQNAAILASHKRKPNKSSWNDEGSAQRSQPIVKPFDGDKI
jgi:excisionase family DNA binding protein